MVIYMVTIEVGMINHYHKFFRTKEAAIEFVRDLSEAGKLSDGNYDFEEIELADEE